MAQTAFAHVHPGAPLSRCEYCGEEFEPCAPLWQELGDGTVTLSCSGALDERGTGRIWHPACLGHATVHLAA